MELFPAFLSALWIGVLTSISPCALTTNTAAVFYVSRSLGKPRSVIGSSLLYTLGRAAAYIVLTLVITSGLSAASNASYFLQIYMNKLLGPLLIIVGMFLLGLIELNYGGMGVSEGIKRRAESLGILGAGLLGLVFAFTFCPVSAAMYFGTMIPLAVKTSSSLLLPLAFGIGTGLPVLVLGVIGGFSVSALSKAVKGISKVEPWSRKITGVVFIVIGVYCSIIFIFRH